MGGWDLLTPALSLPPGKCFDAQNYEPEIAGGYSRINGYERYDGHASPTAALYWTMTAAITGALAVGQTITGASSAATAKILQINGTTLVTLILGRVSGTFTAGEGLKVGGVTQATAVTTAFQQGESNPSDDADYTLLAANDQRTLISAVPGAGPITGVAIYADTVYAFRDNAGRTANIMWKATTSGWSQIVFKNEIRFTTAVGQINIGDTITGATSGATGTVVAALLMTGTWTVAGVGSLVYTVTAGAFVSGEAIRVGGVTKVTSSSAGAAITRAPGGQLDYSNGNFTGSTATLKMYGADGASSAFEFDGTNYIPIHTGMVDDRPSHVIFHRSYLWLSFLGSVQFSGVGNPYSWSVNTGGGELGMSDVVTGFLPQGGNSQGSSMAIFTKGKTSILYGSSTGTFSLFPSIYDLGYSAFTMCAVSNNTYGITARGIQSLITTLTYGDFDYASVSHMVQPFMVAKRGTETCATSSRQRDQYRVYFSDGSALVVGLTGDNISGLMPLYYPKVVRCVTTATLNSGTEVTYFGSDDGFVYQENVGTSFDGTAIEAWIRPAFNNSKSPRVRKRYRRAVFEVKSYGYARVSIGYELGYASPEVLTPVGITNTAIFSGGFWDQFTWDHFTWDSKVFTDISMTLTGTEKNISFLFYSNRAQDNKHTVQGVTLMHTPQRAER